MLSFDLDPELWLDDPEDEEEQADEPPVSAVAAPPPVRNFANIGRLPAPDATVLPRRTVTQPIATGDCKGDNQEGGETPHFQSLL